MGTRHLICVVKNGEYKVAQYGQWDGYPSGQGKDILNFLNSEEFDLEVFRKKVDQVRWLTEEEIKTINSMRNWQGKYPYLSRDCGADILNHIFNSDEPLTVNDSLSFAGDSLFCEWAYVINLDNDTLEVYSGFNKQPLKEDERFYGCENSDSKEYYPVKFVKEYDLHNLPSDKEFIDELEKDEG